MMINIFLKRIRLRRDLILNRKWSDINYILSRKEEFSRDFLGRHKNIQEIEHQVGRYLNMKDIANEILANNYSGDVVEFCTYQGLGLIYLSELIRKKDVLFIGLDSFEGLPIDSTIWKQGMFNETSTETVYKNLHKYSKQSRFLLIKGWYNLPTVREQLYQATKDVVLVHFDADLKVSTYDALVCMTPFLEKRREPMYLLFDDWGCHPDEVPEAFYEWIRHYQVECRFNVDRLSSTRFTRYYRLTPR